MRKNLPFIITMSVFLLACAVVTALTIRDEPQYVTVVTYDTETTTTNAAEEEILKININTATPEELQTISGIGEVIAARIIAYREENGGFFDIEEIMEVAGIGEGVFANIKEYICVE